MHRPPNPELPALGRLPPFHLQTLLKTLADELSLSLRIPGPRPGVGYRVEFFEVQPDLQNQGGSGHKREREIVGSASGPWPPWKVVAATSSTLNALPVAGSR